MRKYLYPLHRSKSLWISIVCMIFVTVHFQAQGQTLAFPGAEGFGKFTQGARGVANPQVYKVTNLEDSGPGSFRDAVSQPGRFVVFEVGGIIRLNTPVVVSSNTTIAGQTAPGDGIVLYGRRVSFSGADNTIARHLRIRLGANGGGSKSEDASGVANGANMVFDHMSFSWGQDEVFSINWDGKGNEPTNITIQNSIIGQGLHRHNHSAGGLMETSNGKISIIKSLYTSNKTRNPKVKGINEFVNNVVYNFGNFDNPMGHTVSGDGYIMGGSSSISEVNIINNYFVSGPLTPNKSTPFSRGTETFNLYGSGNYFDSNKNGELDGSLVPYNTTGYPGVAESGFKAEPYPYPAAAAKLTAEEAYQYVINNVGASYPRRDQVDMLMVAEVESRGTEGMYIYRENDIPLNNGGLGDVFGAPAPLDSDDDGMPDQWEDSNGLDKSDAGDAVVASASEPGYLNIEVYINALIETPAPEFIKPPSNVVVNATSMSEATISWIDNANNEDYIILERSADGTTFELLAELPANTTSYDDDGLSSRTTYFYRLKASNATETSAYSEPASVTTPGEPDAPSNPDPADLAEIRDFNTINLNWEGSSNTSTYQFYFGTGANDLQHQASVSGTSYQVSELAEETTYYWKIIAENEYGTAEGDTWSFNTLTLIPKTIVGHWKLDASSGTMVADASSFANNGEVVNIAEPQWVPGKINNAIDLSNGNTNSLITIPHQEQLFFDESSFSVSFWMKAPSNYPQDQAYLFHKGAFGRNSNGGEGKWFGMELKDGLIRFAVDDHITKTELQINDNSPFLTNEWVHVVAVRDTENDKIRIYRDGIMIGEKTDGTNTPIGTPLPLLIGNSYVQSAPFKGMLDEFRVYNYTLSQEEIYALQGQEPGSSLVGHWKFDETSGSVAADATSHLNHGAIIDITNPQWVEGKENNALDMSNASPSSRIEVPNEEHLNFDENSFSVSLWMKASSQTGPSTYLFSKGAFGHDERGGTGKWYGLEMKDGLFRFSVDDDITKSTVTVGDNSPFLTDEWVHVVAVRERESNKLKLYRNGVIVAEAADNTTSPIGTMLPLLIGNAHTHDAAYYGGMDEFKVFDYSLSQGEIEALAASAPGPEPGPVPEMVANWMFDEVSGTTAEDASTYENHAELLNFDTPQWVPGKIMNAIDLSNESANGHIKAPHQDQLFFDVNSFSVSFWMKAPSDYSPGQAYLFHKGAFGHNDQGGDGKWFGLELKDGLFRFAVDDDITKTEVQINDNRSFLSGDWVHVVAVRDTEKDQLKIYRNGVLAAAQTDNTNMPIGTALPLLIGNSYNLNAPFKGMMDGFKVFNYALSDSEIQNLSNEEGLVERVANLFPENGATAVNSENISLEWEGDADSFNLYFGTSEGGLDLLEDSFSDKSYVIEQAPEITTYFWRVDAVKEGKVAMGETWSFTVEDKVLPEVLVQDITVTLEDGIVTISAENVDDGSSDAYGIRSMSLNKDSFSCSEIGDNEVILTVTDNNGNETTATATVTVVGAIPVPEITLSRTDNTPTGAEASHIYLGYGAQEVMLTATDAGSSQTNSFSWSPATGLSDPTVSNPIFTPTEAGTFNFTVTATNEYDCMETAEVTITVSDAVCGQNSDKVLLCHNGMEICIDAVSVQDHLGHGCKIGSCSGSLVADKLAEQRKKEAQQMESSGLTSYPNPVTNKAVIKFAFDKDTDFCLELYNMEGVLLEVVSTGKVDAYQTILFELNTYQYSTGIYLLKMKTESELITERIVIQK